MALFWLIAGSAVALSLLVTQAAGERTLLLHVGSTNPLLAQIERDLGHVVPTDPIGHDGQFITLLREGRRDDRPVVVARPTTGGGRLVPRLVDTVGVVKRVGNTEFAGSSTAGNLGIPFVGFMQGIRAWVTSEREAIEILPAILVMSALAAAIVAVVLRRGVTRYLLVPWLVLAMCSTLAVWGKPNNPARVFTILWPLGVLNLARAAAGRRGATTEKA